MDSDSHYMGLSWTADAYGSANARFSQPKRYMSNIERTQEDVITGKERGAFVDVRLVPDNKNSKRLMPQMAFTSDSNGTYLSQIYFDNSSHDDVIHVITVNTVSDAYGLAKSELNWLMVACGDILYEAGGVLTSLAKGRIEQILGHEMGHQFMPSNKTDERHPKIKMRIGKFDEYCIYSYDFRIGEKAV